MDNSDIQFFEDEKKAWSSFQDSLRAEDKEFFKEMLNLCSRYATVIRISSKPSSEALFMTILFLQHRVMKWLSQEVQKLKEELGAQKADDP